MNIPDDLRVDWDTLNEPYVTPVTLEWAIERDKNMQSFAKKLIEHISKLAAEFEESKEALRIACADAWPDNPYWPELYMQRARNNIATREAK